jgi:hypothetical protein
VGMTGARSVLNAQPDEMREEVLGVGAYDRS